MRRRLLSALLLFLAWQAQAQEPTPFDMAPEQGGRQEQLPRPPVDPAPPAVQQTPTLAPTPPIAYPDVPPQQQAAPGEPSQASPPTAGGGRRYIIPFAELVLAGEVDRRDWSHYLTGEQAAAPATLRIAYQSALVVAPETSFLEVVVNGTTLVREPVRSSETVSTVSAPVPAGLLKAGVNAVSIRTTMRHRTDCTVQSTYELWLQVETAGTYLEFAQPLAGSRAGIEDVAAVGVDPQGRTSLRMIVPALGQRARTASIVRLSEGLAMLANMPNPQIEVSAAPAAGAEAGAMTVLLGTAAELTPVFPDLPAEASTAPVASFVDRGGTTVLVVTGPSWSSVESAIESIVAPLQRPLTSRRSVVSTEGWRAPNAPLFYEAGTKSFLELGIATQEFAGRRFRTDFAFAVPPDFYANDYGQARLLLDAAYTTAVRPGSHIDVYVNSDIAATMPITQDGGAILRHQPIDVTMRHFRPGPNVVTIEAVLMTAEDAVCVPGSSGGGAPRFALFDTSEFSIPAFARVARRPDLGAMAGTGYPYGRAEKPVVLHVDHASPAAVSAAATLLAKMSIAAGRPIEIESGSNQAAGERHAIFIDAISALQPSALSRVGLAPDAAARWTSDAGAPAGPSTGDAFERWRDELSGSGWRGSVSRLHDWVLRTFDVNLGGARVAAGEGSFVPPRGARLVVAQQFVAETASTWTIVAAPTADGLQEAVAALARQDNWARMSGQIATLDATLAEVATVAPAQVSFVATQPFSLRNVRLIAANWLSANPASYAAGLSVLCVLLGLATTILLSSIGRRS